MSEHAPAVLVHGNPETDPLLDELGPDDVVRLSPPGFGAPIPPGYGWGGGHVVTVAMARPDLPLSRATDAIGLFDPDYVWHDLARTWQTLGEGANLATAAGLWRSLGEAAWIGYPRCAEPARVRRARRSGTIPSVWDTLSEPWRACVELAWEAYRADSLPIGAVVADAEGRVLAFGRNRIHERSGPPGAVFGRKLAHAELNALLSLEGEEDPRVLVLFTTTEPCPLCAGAARMADVGGLRYAAREPWAGSAAMFETVPYLRRGNPEVVGPEDLRLEAVLVALQVERFLRLKPKVLVPFLRLYEEVMPRATRAARDAHGSGWLRAMSADGASAREVVRALNERIPFPA